MKYWFSLFLIPLLVSCGGGNQAAVFDIQATNLHYGSAATFLFVGNYVADQGLKVNIPNCAGQTPVYSTSTEFAVRCFLNTTGDLNVQVTNAAGAPIYAKTLTVPALRVSLDTSMGKIVAELNPTAAPITVNNFLGYALTGFYTNTLFHRVIPGFVIQGGGFVSGLTPQTGAGSPITLESNKGLSNLRGTLAMARTSDPNSATSQFYFNLADNTSLDYKSADNPGYAVFGKIVEGLDVMDAIGKVPTSVQDGQPDVPVNDVVINSVTRIQ